MNVFSEVVDRLEERLKAQFDKALSEALEPPLGTTVIESLEASLLVARWSERQPTGLDKMLDLVP